MLPVQGVILGAVKVVVVISPFVVVLIVVSIVRRAPYIIHIHLLSVPFPPPLVSPISSLWWVYSQIGKGHPVKLDLLEPSQQLLVEAALLFNAGEELFEYVRAAAQEDCVVLAENFESFASDLPV
jgi:ABC-type amino acid transport system permease subunit